MGEELITTKSELALDSAPVEPAPAEGVKVEGEQAEGDLAEVKREIVPPPPRQRVRIIYEKGERIKFISHLDEFRMWERTLRRADLPILYKQGFNPQPHIQFASPLGVGITGAREPIDITFSPPLPMAELEERIQKKLPPGAAMHSIEEVPLKTTALQSLLIGADYTIFLYAEPDEIPQTLLAERIEEFLAKKESWHERERKKQKYTYNLRPLVFELSYLGYEAEREEHRIFLRVQQRAGATGRPDEVVSALGFDAFARTLRRDQLYFEDRPDDLSIFEPYPVILKEDILSENDKLSRTRFKRSKRKRGGKSRRSSGSSGTADTGRSINERAGDEFD